MTLSNSDVALLFIGFMQVIQWIYIRWIYLRLEYPNDGRR
jgi:hypothetical protein